MRKSKALIKQLGKVFFFLNIPIKIHLILLIYSLFSCFQNQLPATGAPISGMRPGQIKERFDNYVREKTQQNWKFWMVSYLFAVVMTLVALNKAFIF